MTEAEKAKQAAAAETKEINLLDQIVDQGRFGKEAAARDRGKSMIMEFVSQFLEGEMTVSRDADAMYS